MDREGGQQDLLMGPFLKRQIYFTLTITDFEELPWFIGADETVWGYSLSFTK